MASLAGTRKVADPAVTLTKFDTASQRATLLTAVTQAIPLLVLIPRLPCLLTKGSLQLRRLYQLNL